MFLFEHTLPLMLLGFLVVALLLARRIITGDPGHSKIVFLAGMVTAGLVAASWAIVTPRERVAALCGDLARWVDEGNVAQIGGRLASDFSAGGMDRDEFISRLESTLTARDSIKSACTESA